MNWWNRNYGEGSDHFDLAYPPDRGGPLKIAILGFGVAGYLVYLAISIWIHEYAVISSRNVVAALLVIGGMIGMFWFEFSY